MNNIAQDLFHCFVVAILLLGTLVFIFGPPRVKQEEPTPIVNECSKEPTPTPIIDEITTEQVIRVEETCRRFIALWEADLELYNDTSFSTNEKTQEIHARVTTRMNEIAESYNKYLITNGYVFGETLPDGIYAYIEQIEE